MLTEKNPSINTDLQIILVHKPSGVERDNLVRLVNGRQHLIRFQVAFGPHLSLKILPFRVCYQSGSKLSKNAVYSGFGFTKLALEALCFKYFNPAVAAKRRKHFCKPQLSLLFIFCGFATFLARRHDMATSILSWPRLRISIKLDSS